MKFKLNYMIERITSPVVLFTGTSEFEFESGEKAASYEFEKNYVIDSMFVRNNKIIVNLKEAEINNINWIGEEQVSFF